MEQIKIFKEQFITMIPQGFKDLPDEMIALKYPLNGRPEIIKTDESYTTDFKYSLLDVETVEYALEVLCGYVKNITLNSNPGFQFMEDYAWKDGKMNVAKAFSFQNRVLDGVAFNIIGYKQFGREVLNISMSCPYEKKDEYIEKYKQAVLETQREK